MSRAQRRRAEREAKKSGNVASQTARISGLENDVRVAVMKSNLTQEIDRKLYNKYYEIANKNAVDNIYKIVLASFGYALADTCPNWGAVAIARRIQKTMDYVDKFSHEYNGDIDRFMQELEDRTGFSFDVDSVNSSEGGAQ